MSEQKVTLIRPAFNLKSELLAMAAEYSAAGDERYSAALTDPAAFIRRLLDYDKGINLPPHHVRTTFYWLVRDQRIIGRSGIRHKLTPLLEREGGHIGYDIRPSERRKGYGTLILALTLDKAKSFGFNRVMLTCDTDNVASARIIEKNGGQLHERVISERSGRLVSQYWIEI